MRPSKSIAVFLIIILALITISVVQVDYALFTDQTAQSEAAARAQMAALVPAVHSEFNALSENTKTLLSGLVDKGGDFNDSVSSRVEMVARLKPKETGEWELIGKVFHEKTNVRAWAESYSVIALKTIKPKDISQGGAALVSMLDPQRNPFFLWIIREDNERWSAVITKTAIFQSLMDRQKGQLSSVFLVNRQGQVLGHTTSEYLGTLMTEDPIVAEIMAIGKKSGAKNFKDRSGSPFQSFYEQVPYTNIFVVLARPLKAAERARDNLRLQMILLGAGLTLVGVAALVLVSRAENRGRRFTSEGQTGASGPAPTESTSAPAAPLSLDQKTEIMKERMRAFTTSASALARELNGPLVRILSQAQLLKSKVSQEAPEAQKIEALAREGREVIQKLLTFSGEEEFRIEPTSLNESVNRLLSQMESKFQAKGVRVEKNLKRMPEVAANHLGVMKVLEAVLNNSIEAMEKMPSKVIRIDLQEGENGNIILLVQDSGEGFSPENKAKAFDPFFTTKSPSSHSGLGLSMALGIMKEFGGQINIQSVPGQGATTEIIFNSGPAEVGQVAIKPVEPLTPVAPPMASPTLNPLKAPVREGLPPSPAKPAPTPSISSKSPPPAAKAPLPPAKQVPGLLESRSLEETMRAMDEIPDDPPDEFAMEPVTSPLLAQGPSRPEETSLRVRQNQLLEQMKRETESLPSGEDIDEATSLVPLDTESTKSSILPPPVKPAVSAKIDVPKFNFRKPGDKK